MICRIFAVAVLLLVRQAAANDFPVLELHEEYSSLNLLEFGVAIARAPGQTFDLFPSSAPPAFAWFSGEALNTGLGEHPVWLSRTIHNAGTQSGPWALELVNPRIEGVRVAVTDLETGAQTVSPIMGALHSRGSLDYFSPHAAFRVDIPPGATRRIDMLLMHTGSLRFQLMLYPEDIFIREAQTQVSMYCILFGALVIICCTYVFVFFGLREPAYAGLAGLTTGLTLYYTSGSGLGNMFFWEPSAFWSDRLITVALMLTLSTSAWFTAHFFETSISRHLRTALLAFSAANALAMLLALTPGVFKYYVSHTLSVATTIIVLFTAIRTVRTGAPGARLFLCAWAVVSVGGLSLALLGLGVLPYTFLTEHLLAIVFVPAALLWHFALTSRVKQQERTMRETLERTVKERTSELTQALSEVKALSGLLPICSHCKKIRDDGGYWSSVETYISEHTDARFSHSLCPECVETHYPEYSMSRKLQAEREGALPAD